MKFSVLMSVYAKEKPDYLRKSLDSILQEQTRKPDQVVLVKDGPLTAELDQLIQDYARDYSQLKVVALKENQGLGLALREGVQHCQYEWIARMDTDDIAATDRFATQLAYLESHPDTDVLGSEIYEFDEEIDQLVSRKSLPSSHEDISAMLRERNPFCHMTVCFKKSAVLAAGNYQSLPLVEDYYLWVRMAAQGARFANIKQALVYARVGNGMHTRRSDRKQIKSWRVVNDFMLEQGMIKRGQYLKNMTMIRAFIYVPVGLKKYLYKRILRK